MADNVLPTAALSPPVRRSGRLLVAGSDRTNTALRYGAEDIRLAGLPVVVFIEHNIGSVNHLDGPNGTRLKSTDGLRLLPGVHVLAPYNSTERTVAL